MAAIAEIDASSKAVKEALKNIDDATNNQDKSQGLKDLKKA